MLEIENYHYAESLEMAASLLKEKPGATILGGCGYIRLGARKITHAIDLSRLDLDFVRQTDSCIEIGAMTPLRQFETNPHLNSLCSGILSKSVANIVGIQLRNSVTIGGTVGGRYPFSDPITALLALNASVDTFKGGIISLDELLKQKSFKDIVVKIIIPASPAAGAYESMRKSATDYAILNACIVKRNEQFRVVVGARPGRAGLVEAVQSFLNNKTITDEIAAEAGTLTANSIEFGDNPRGSKEYRRAICPVLIKRALLSLIEEEKMQLETTINGRKILLHFPPGEFLAETLRRYGYLSVKQGCDTGNCGLCTVWLDGQPTLSCSTLSARVEDREITTIEALTDEAEEFASFLTAEGAEQCGFCAPGFTMTVLAMKRDLSNPTKEDIEHYLSGNLCRCSGYKGQLRAITRFMG